MVDADRLPPPALPAPSITYALSLWSTSPPLPLIETAPRLPHTLLFVAGLTDTFGTVPYVDQLAIAVAPLGFNVVQPQLSSSLGGFGVSSLEADAHELALVMRHLRTRSVNQKHPDSKVVVMGHSTGCQDMAQLLAFERPGVGVDGVILQAPVSDRDDWEYKNPPGSDARKDLERATVLFEKGHGDQLMERRVELPMRAPVHAPVETSAPTVSYRANAEAVQQPAMSAYRFWSLYAVGGDDDFFSAGLDDSYVARVWNSMLGSDRYVTALLGAEDEFVPPSTKAQDLATKWTDIVAESGDDGRAGRFRAVVVSKANHKIEDETAQHSLVTEVQQTLLRVLGEAENDEKFGPTGPPGQSSGAAGTDQHRGGEQYPASFDEVVELISTGRAESIPGIKHIPLQINDAAPSESTLVRPSKPWERTSGNADPSVNSGAVEESY